MTRSAVMRVAGILMGLVFLFGAAVQYNDPDPWRWGLVYLAAAAVSFVALARPLPWPLPAAMALAAFVWALTLLGRIDIAVWRELFGEFGMASLEIEEAREALGLIIIGAWMTVLAVAERWHTSRR